MPLSSLITGVIAAVYTAKDGEVNLERAAAMLAALVAAWVLFKRAARRYWQRGHPDAPASAFPLDR